MVVKKKLVVVPTKGCGKFRRGLSIIASFLVPGLGQISVGKYQKGIQYLIMVVIAVLITIIQSVVVVGYVLYALVWLMSMYDIIVRK